MLNLTSLYLNVFQVSLATLMQLNPLGGHFTVTVEQFASLHRTPNALELAKGEPYQSPYERENVEDRNQDRELEEIRRTDYERRGEDRYNRSDDDYIRDDEYSQYQQRRQALEERRQEIERQIEELDYQYGY